MKYFVKSTLAMVIITVVSSAGCGRAAGEGNNSSLPAATTKQAVASSPRGGKVARVVFIDQEQACECTRNRIKGSWTAVEAALGEGSGIVVERIHRDTQEEQAEQYRMLRPMVTVPGLYFLDENGAIVELLQGEITEEQVRNALGGRS